MEEKKMKDKVNVLFVCGYGVGSSAISESIVKKALAADGINADVYKRQAWI